MALSTSRQNSIQFIGFLLNWISKNTFSPSPSFALGILFLLISLQWKPTHTFVNTVAISRRKLTERCWLHLFQSSDEVTSDMLKEVSIENDSQNDLEQFGGGHHLHLSDDDNQSEEFSDGERNEVPLDDDSVNLGVNNWFTDRNKRNPRILEDLFQKSENFKSEETPLIAIEDFDWFEPTLEKIEHKYEKRKKKLILSLTLDRKYNPLTVPLRVNEMLERVLRDEMDSEIKLKYGKMKFERAKALEKNNEETISMESVGEIKQQFSINKYGISAGDHDMKRSKSPTFNKLSFLISNTEQKLSLKSKMLSVKRDIKNNRIKGKYCPGDHMDWKKLQEIRTHVKDQTSDGDIDEEEVERKFLEWKKFIFTQDMAIKETLEQQGKKPAKDNGEGVRGKSTGGQEIQEQSLDTNSSVISEEGGIAEGRTSMIGSKEDSEVQDEKITFSNAVKNINCSSLQALEKLLEKQGETFERTSLEKSIRDLRESLKAVDYVDIKMDDECEEEKKKEGNDVTIDFTDIFPVQAARLRKEKELKVEQNWNNRLLFDRRVEYSREQDFSNVEELMRKDIMSSISKNEAKSAEERLMSSQKALNETIHVKRLGKTSSEQTFTTAERQKPPNTPFFQNMPDLGKKTGTPKKGCDDEKSYEIVGNDLNMPPEDRNTTLLGTFEEQRMQNFYRKAKLTTEEDQTKARKNFEDFQSLQEKKMQQLEETDHVALWLEQDDFIKGGDVDTEKVLAYFEAKCKSHDDEMNKEEEVRLDERNNWKDIASDLELSNTSKFSKKDVEKMEDKTKDDIRRNNFTCRESSDIDLPPEEPLEEGSTVLLGTFEQQHMNNLYRQSGIEKEEEKEEYNRKYKEFLQKQEEGMQKLNANVDEHHEFKSLVNDGELDTQKVFSWIEEKRKNIDESGGSLSANVDTDRLKELELKNEKSCNKMKNSKNSDDIAAKDAMAGQSSAQKQQVTHERKENRESFEIQNVDTRDKLDAFSSNFVNDLNVVKSDGLSDSNEISCEKLDKENDGLLAQEYINAEEDMKVSNAEEEDFDENRRRIEEIVRSESSSRDFYELFGRRPGEYDYDDYRKVEYELVRDENADLSTYRVRKKMLLDLEVFSKHEVDMLMDVKDRIELNGVSAHMVRLRKPFKEFGAIFRLEGVLVDLTGIQNSAWIRVAEELNLRKPSDDSLRFASVQTPEYAVRRIFYWTKDYQFCTQIGKLYNQYLKEKVKLSFPGQHVNCNEQLEKDAPPSDKGITLPLTAGVKSWIKALNDVEMPVALVSYLDDETVSTLLNVTGLAELFPSDRRVTKTNGFSRDSYLQLAACLHVDRRPDSCLLFEANMEGLKVARENELRSVGLTTVYPMYELQAADSTVRDFNYMTAMNIRRLFGERTYHEPLTMPDSPLSKIQKRKVLTVYPGDEDGKWYGDENDGIGGGNVDGKGNVKKNLQYDDDIEQDRYYGEDNYSPLAYSDIQEDGLLYDEEEENDLFQ